MDSGYNIIAYDIKLAIKYCFRSSAVVKVVGAPRTLQGSVEIPIQRHFFCSAIECRLTSTRFYCKSKFKHILMLLAKITTSQFVAEIIPELVINFIQADLPAHFLGDVIPEEQTEKYEIN